MSLRFTYNAPAMSTQQEKSICFPSNRLLTNDAEVPCATVGSRPAGSWAVGCSVVQ